MSPGFFSVLCLDDRNKTNFTVSGPLLPWPEALDQIQFMKNTRFHRGIGMTPYEAFLGMKPRMGLQNLNIDKEVTDKFGMKKNWLLSLKWKILGTEEIF